MSVFRTLHHQAALESAQYPSPDAKPSFDNILLFGMISAMLNAPVVSLFEELYKRVGAAVVVRYKHNMLGKSLIKGDPDKAAARLKEVETAKEADMHVNVVMSACKHQEELLEKQRTRLALMRSGSALRAISLQQLNELEEKYEAMKVQLTVEYDLN